MDTGIFDEDRYWNIEVDYAKDDPTDIYIRIRITNAGPGSRHHSRASATLVQRHLELGPSPPPTEVRHVSRPNGSGTLVAEHWRAGIYHLDAASGPNGHPTAIFCENETNNPKIWGDSVEPLTDYPEGRHQRSRLAWGSNG